MDEEKVKLPQLTQKEFLKLGKEAHEECNSGFYDVLRLLYKKLDPYMKFMHTERQAASGYHRPVCTKCHCELHPETNGIGVLDLADWGPCELYDAELWKCPSCKMEVVGGFGYGSISAHFKPDFQHHIDRYKKNGLLIENKG